MVNAWWNRLLGAVYGGGFSTQEAEYEDHATRRDYLWNTLGTAVWGMAFPLLTIVSTQLVGAEEAGKFSIAFVTGTLIMIACNYGVRNFQVSDIDEKTSFASYQLNRWICGALALACGLVYSSARGYDAQMATIGLGVYLYKVIDGIADVYEGRLQQADKLYLAGMSQTLRSSASSRSLAWRCSSRAACPSRPWPWVSPRSPRSCWSPPRSPCSKPKNHAA